MRLYQLERNCTYITYIRLSTVKKRCRDCLKFDSLYECPRTISVGKKISWIPGGPIEMNFFIWFTRKRLLFHYLLSFEWEKQYSQMKILNFIRCNICIFGSYLRTFWLNFEVIFFSQNFYGFSLPIPEIV